MYNKSVFGHFFTAPKGYRFAFMGLIAVYNFLGYSQVVRRRFLIPICKGSSPFTPIFWLFCDKFCFSNFCTYFYFSLVAAQQKYSQASVFSFDFCLLKYFLSLKPAVFFRGA